MLPCSRRSQIKKVKSLSQRVIPIHPSVIPSRIEGSRTTNRTAEPSYIAIAAMTLDGKIAANHKHFTDWTSPEDKTFMRKLLEGCDVVVVGHNTYETAKKPLSKRNCIVFTRDTKLPNRKTIPQRRIRLGRKKLLFVNPRMTNVDNLIRSLGYQRVAILGGTQTYTYFLEHNLLDDLYLTIEPVVFGHGLPLFDATAKIQRPRIVSIQKLNRTATLLVHAVFSRTAG